MRRASLGLRAQISIALGVAFAAASTLLASAALNITARTRAYDEARSLHRLGQAIGTVADLGPVGAREAASAVLSDRLIGISYEGPSGNWSVGELPDERATFEHRDDNGGRVFMWTRSLEDDATTNLRTLLLLYFAITGGGILVLTIVGLTYWIVRPVEALTRASERLAAGSPQVAVRVGGAAEVARLGEAFNSMSTQLRAERLALEARLRDLERATKELAAAQEMVVRGEKLASVGRLASGVAHEIGNPLAAILGLVELLETTELDDASRKEFLRRIHAETERIHKIIRELLSFARADPPPAPTDATCDVAEVVEDAVRLLGPQKRLADITIERRFTDGVPKARIEHDRLRQVVLNLVLNASDAMGGHGALEIEVSEASGESDEVVLAVTDTGPGISPNVLHRIFEPFVTTKPVGQGTGLGLAVSHSIIVTASGTIRASNVPAGGARFEVRLPAVKGPEREPERAIGETPRSS